MHQRKRLFVTRTRRRLSAAIAAVALAGTLIASTGWSPLCVLYEPWSFLWVWNQCWNAPPNPPEG